MKPPVQKQRMLSIFRDRARLRARRVTMTWLVGLAFGALISISMLLVLGLAVSANVKNTFSLLNDKAILTTNALERRVRGHLDLAQTAVESLKLQLDARPHDLSVADVLRPILLAAVHANPAIDVLVITSPDGKEDFGVYRSETGKLWPFQRQVVPEIVRRYKLPDMRPGDPATWGELIDVENTLYANVTVPLEREGAFSGYLTAAVSMDEVGRSVAQLDDGPHATIFIIAHGDKVIAHSDLELLPHIDGKPPRLPSRVEDFPDAALKRLGTSPTLENFEQASAVGVTVYDLESQTAAHDYLAMTKTLSGYGPENWVLGQYYEASSVSREVQRLIGSAGVGLISVLVALVLSILLVKRAARPLHSIADRAQHVGMLEFDRVDPLPRSRIHELDQVNQAFNAMVVGLRAMNTYVPRSLFRKLMRLGVDRAAVAQERDLTLVFTDIVGFTTVSEHLSAVETATLLNEHFALLVEAVEGEGGTVDKFLGDGMLAFWGAPDTHADHAEAAMRACLAIAEGVRKANAEAAANGQSPLRLRIGLHSGKVVVGNVGALDRWNYTVVGDAVNLCERLQSLGREVAPDAEIVILASDATMARVGDIPATSTGTHRIRGRSELVSVWRVDETSPPSAVGSPQQTFLAGE